MSASAELPYAIGAWVGACGTDGARGAGFALLRRRPRGSRTDTQSREIVLYAFPDSERWANTEAVVLQTSPGLVYISAESVPAGDASKLELMLQASLSTYEGAGEDDAASFERVGKSAFADADVRAHLEKLAGGSGVPPSALAMPLALKAAACLISKGKLIAHADSAGEGDEGAAGSYRITVAALDAYVRLDAAAVIALNLLPPMTGTAAAAALVAVASDAAGGEGVGGVAGTSKGKHAKGASSSAPITSLLGLLSRGCRTKGGPAILKAWILQPLVSPSAIRARQDMVKAFVDSSQLSSEWKSKLAAVPDVESLARKFSRNTAKLPDMLRIYSFANQLRSIVKMLRKHVAVGDAAAGEDAGEEDGEGDGGDDNGVDGLSPVLARFKLDYVVPLTGLMREFLRFLELVEALVTDPTDLSKPRVKPSYSEELAALDKQRREARSAIDEAHDKALDSWGSDLSGLKLVEDKAKGWKWRVSKKDEKAVRGLPGVSAGDITVLKDGIYFSNARLERAAEKLEAIDVDYVKAQGEIVKVALEQALTYLPVLEATASIVSELDAYAGMAHIVSSSAGQYTLPVFVEAGEGTGAGAGAGAASGEPPRRCLRVKGGRHPIMEMGEDVSFIANDYDLLGAAPDETPWAEGCAASEAVASPAAKRPRVAAAAAGAEDMSMQPCRFNIVTGPNMGGKSTYIRTLGVLAVMAQMGSYVSADSMEMTALDAVCARVGAGDWALKGVSTFMSEMIEASTILSTATDKSLVIIDELGRGTSTYDGFGLAWAISEHLAMRTRAFTLFATHFHELTALADELPRGVVANSHVSAITGGGGGTGEGGSSVRAGDGVITFLYSVRAGPCPASFGIAVARIAKFPAVVLAAATAKAAQLEATSGIILSKHRKRGLERDDAV